MLPSFTPLKKGLHLRTVRFALPVLLAAGLSGGSASASTVANDTFVSGTGNYTSATNLLNQNSTSSYGFTGAWGGANSGDFEPITSANLPFSGIPNAGTLGLEVFSFTNGNFSRTDNRSFTPSASPTLWFGSLINPSANASTAGSTEMVGMLSGTLPQTNASAGVTNYGASSSTGALWNTANGGSLGGFAWGISAGVFTLSYQSGASTTPTVSNAAPTLAVGALNAGTTYLLIAQLTVNSADNDTLNVWVKTSTPASQSALGTADFTYTGDLLTSAQSINTLNAYAGAPLTTTAVSTTVNFDAITVGTTYADILAPVPEPSTFLCVGLILLSAGCGRKLWRRKVDPAA